MQKSRLIFFVVCLLSCSVQLHSQKNNVADIRLKDTATVNRLNEQSRLFLQTDSSAALNYAQSAYDLAAQIHYKAGQAKAMLRLGGYYGNRNEFTLAMQSFLKAVDLSDTHNLDIKGQSYVGLAQVYKDMSGDQTRNYLDKGLDYSRMALETFSSIKDSGGMANSLNQAGIIYRDKARTVNSSYYDSAYHSFISAIELVKINKKGFAILPKLYNNISQVYTEYKKDYTTGLKYLFLAADENKRINSVWGLTHNYGNISATYLKLKNNQLGLEYAKKMLQAAKEIQRPLRVYSAYNTLYAAFNAAHRYDSALHYFVLATSLNDSLTNISRTQQVIELQTKYETAKKELQIQSLSLESSSKSKRILLLIAALIATAAIALGFIWLYRRVQGQKKTLNLQQQRLEGLNDELQLQKKELEEVGMVKDKLFSVISHDLQTPVNTLISFADLLESSEVKPEKLKSYMAVLKGTLSKTSSLMTNLLQWAASQMHGFKPVIEKTNVTGVIEKVLQEMEQQANQKQVTLTNLVTENTFASADKDMLTVIFRNLIANGVKYTDAKTGHITIASAVKSNTVTVSVTDNGVGMDSNLIEQFNNETMMHPAQSKEGTAKEKGTGLGLMLSKALIRLMNGKIVADSGTNGGTTFKVYIPSEVQN